MFVKLSFESEIKLQIQLRKKPKDTTTSIDENTQRCTRHLESRTIPSKYDCTTEWSIIYNNTDWQYLIRYAVSQEESTSTLKDATWHCGKTQKCHQKTKKIQRIEIWINNITHYSVRQTIKQNTFILVTVILAKNTVQAKGDLKKLFGPCSIETSVSCWLKTRPYKHRWCLTLRSPKRCGDTRIYQKSPKHYFGKL